jgi:hypothetical protein
MIHIEITQDMKDIAINYNEAHRSQICGDRRTKHYKECDSQKQELLSRGRALIMLQAVEIVKQQTKCNVSSDGEVKVSEDFKVYIKPIFSIWDGEIDAYFIIDDEKQDNRYGRNNFWISTDEESMIDAIQEKLLKFNELKIKRANEKTIAGSFYDKVKADISYKSYDGQQLRSEYLEESGKVWDKYAKMEAEFENKKVVIKLNFRYDFDDEDKAVAFWNAMQVAIKTLDLKKGEEHKW